MASRTRASKKKLEETVQGIVKKLKPEKYSILHDNEIRSENSENRMCDVFKNGCQPHEHVKIIHDNYRPFECVLCHIAFKKASHYQRHLNEIHNRINNRPHKCEVCKAKFKRAEQLESHSKEVHSKMKNRTHKCALCHTTFKRPSHLSRHLKEVHDKVKPYKCKKCNAGFTRKSYIQRHVQSTKSCRRRKPSVSNGEDQIDAPIPKKQEQCEIKTSVSDSTFGTCTVL